MRDTSSWSLAKIRNSDANKVFKTKTNYPITVQALELNNSLYIVYTFFVGVGGEKHGEYET